MLMSLAPLTWSLVGTHKQLICSSFCICIQQYGTWDKIQSSQFGTVISKAMSIGKMMQLIKHPHNMLRLKCVSMCKHRFQCVQHPLCQRAVVDTHPLHSMSQCCRYTPSIQHNRVGQDKRSDVCNSTKRGVGLSLFLISSTLTD